MQALMLLNRPDQSALACPTELLDLLRREESVRSVFARYRREHAECQFAYAHGERHDLFWEFPLVASFRWQAYLGRMDAGSYQVRFNLLTGALGLRHLLDRPALALTRSQQARANLALALLPQPELLLWEEPLAVLSRLDVLRAVRLLRHLSWSEGLTTVAVSADPLGLLGLEAGQTRKGETA